MMNVGQNIKRLYVDNAATSFPKPPEVLKAMETGEGMAERFSTTERMQMRYFALRLPSRAMVLRVATPVMRLSVPLRAALKALVALSQRRASFVSVPARAVEVS